METVQSLIQSFSEAHAANKMTKPMETPEFQITSNNITPFFAPEEKRDLKGYYSDIEDGECDKLYDDLVFESNIDTTSAARPWMYKVNQLQIQLKNTENPEKIDEIKQRLIALGWNPEIKFTEENAVKASRRFISIMQEKLIKFNNIQDVSEMYVDDYEVVNEAKWNANLNPVYICFVKGNALFSNAITFFTNGEFSHAALSLDESMQKMYSFNLVNGNKGGGFSLEDIRKYPQDNRFATYVVFVSNAALGRIKKVVKDMEENAGKTSYAVNNILTFPFKFLGNNNKITYNMICSQFVDGLLKIANRDITRQSSSKVSPSELYLSIKNDSKVFKIFDGITKNYRSSRTLKIINRLRGSNTKLESCILEKSLPFEIRDNGDVLLTNPFPNFDEEYFASHKLLENYKRTNNIEGMKYELARLYYMNYVLETRLYHNKILVNKEANIKTRARILNDFNKYLKYVSLKDKNFNFGEYYEASPFYAHTIKISGSTIVKLKDIMKMVL